MAKKLHIPTYPSKPHPTGQARCRIGGNPVYLGKWGSKESHEKFARLTAEYLAGFGQSLEQLAEKQTDLTIAELVNAHRKWAEARYVKNGEPTSEVQSIRTALRPVVRLYGQCRVQEFGPLKLKACRTWFVQWGYTRGRINTLLTRIKGVFRWGVSNELLSGTIVHNLECVPGLRTGEEGVKESKEVEPVADALVEAIQPHVTPPVWAMVQLQRLTGMRPGEVCQMRTRDVLREDPLRKLPAEIFATCWVYEPESHKTEHHGRRRIILLGPKAQEVLQPWLRPDNPEAYLFSPAEAQAYRHKLRTVARKTAGKASYKPKKNPQRKPGDRYRTSAYGHAIAKACKKAGVAHWHPHQLRHSACTEVAAIHGIEVARIILGHAKLNTTQLYEHRDLKQAAKIVFQQG